MNDIDRNEEFLQLIKEIAKTEYIDEKTVYNNLVFFETKRKDIGNMFQDWIKDFESVENIDVYQDDWQYFCQFRSKESNYIPVYNKIKIYVPLDEEHIYEGAKKIFNYLSQINASHVSKIAKKTRLDGIVLRVDGIETANKIKEFILNDPYIKEGLNGTIPFAFNDGYLSYAWDGFLSYNNIVSRYIASYINDLKEQNKLEEVSYKSFITYVKNIWQEVFIGNKNIELYKEKMNFYNIDDNDYGIERVLEVCDNITRILLKAMLSDSKIDDFYQEYNSIVSPNSNIFSMIYTSMIEKYQDYSEVNDIIFKYLLTNNKNKFTRDANGMNLRKFIVEKNITNEALKDLIINDEKREEKRNILLKAAIETFEKYGEAQVLGALNNAQNSGYFENFTNEFNRSNLKQVIHQGEIIGLIRETLLKYGYEIDKIPEEETEIYDEYIELIKSYLHNKRK